MVKRFKDLNYTFLIFLLFPSVIHPFSLFSKSDGGPHHPHHHHGNFNHTDDDDVHLNSSVSTTTAAEDKPVPLFIAHRGDKFLMPEHTVPAYDLAMLTNVDYVEPDLVMTKDGHLVCHHDITLRDGTDVSSHLEFAALMTKNRTLFLDGKNVTILDDWLISDFTLAQLSTLRVYQKQTGWRPQYFNGYYGIPTFLQYLDAVHKDTWRRQREAKLIGESNNFVMGVIPELKHPLFHNSQVFRQEHRMESTFLAALASNGYLENQCRYNGTEIPCSPMVVQCFQVETIAYLSEATNLTLLTLLDTQNLRYLTYGGMRELTNKTTYIGLWKELLYTGTAQEVIYQNVTYDKEEVDRLEGFVGPQDLVEYAHELGLKVGIYTIYHSEENSYRGCAVQCEADTTKEQELDYYLTMGVDAFFVEGLSESLRIRDRWLEAEKEERETGRGGSVNSSYSLWLVMVGVVMSALFTKHSI